MPEPLGYPASRSTSTGLGGQVPNFEVLAFDARVDLQQSQPLVVGKYLTP
jgi:hypothetical protein